MAKQSEPLFFLLMSAAMLLSLVVGWYMAFNIDVGFSVVFSWIQIPLFVMWLLSAVVCVPSVSDRDEKKGYIVWSWGIGVAMCIQYVIVVCRDVYGPR